MFGGQKPPARTTDIYKNDRVFLFMVDGAIKRYALYQGKKYPEELRNLYPAYLSMRKEELFHLKRLSYKRVAGGGYRLSLTNPKPGEMNIIISPKGIKYEISSGEGA